MTIVPQVNRPYRIDGKTRLLSRLAYFTETYSAIAVCVVQAGLPGLLRRYAPRNDGGLNRGVAEKPKGFGA
jgi:hypothetical protein